MFEITDYKIEALADGRDSITVYFHYLGEDTQNIVVELWDRIFQTTGYGRMTMTVGPNGNYWCQWSSWSHKIDSGHQKTTKFNHGVTLRFHKESGGVIDEKDLVFLITDKEKRTQHGKFSYSKKNVWIVGDSNVPYLFTDNDDSVINRRNFHFNQASHLSLTVNRFNKCNSIDYLKTIPLVDGDTIFLLLGEIDLRYSILKFAGEHSETLLRRILREYSATIEKIQKAFPNITLGILMPPPPLKDNIVNDLESIIPDSQEQRKQLYDIFKSYFKNEVLDGRLKTFWDCYESYKDKEGYLITEFLAPNDHHIGNSKFFFESLIEKLEEHTYTF